MAVEVKAIMKVKVHSKIDEYLSSRGTTKAWLARQIKARPPQLNDWCKNDENGYAISQPSVGYVLRMIKALDCSIHDLWEYKEE